jgi:hypothetical protein
MMLQIAAELIEQRRQLRSVFIYQTILRFNADFGTSVQQHEPVTP